jgi:cytochrome c peroxidase
VPSLRNLAFTAPYMHDGRFNTLMGVLNFYNENVRRNSPNIDPSMGKFANGLGLNLQDKMDIIAFLNTLNDPNIETDTLFQNPYQ